MTIAELRKKRADAVAAAKGLTEKAKAENRDLTAEEAAQVEQHLATAKAAKEQADAAQRAADLAAQVDAEADDVAQAPAPRTVAGAAQPGRAAAAPAASSQPAQVRDRVEGDRTRGFASLGHFAAAVHRANPNIGGEVHANLRGLVAAQGMNQGMGADGGFLVPPQFATQIWDGLNQSPENLLTRVDQYTVEGESLTFPANAETSRATGSRYGGIQGYWIQEAGQITKSSPKLRQMKLEPQQLAVLVYVTEKLLNNSPVALDQYVARAATDEIMFMIGDAILNGSGAGKPKGIMNSGALITVAKETSQAAATFLQANVSKMWARLHARSRANAVWLMNQDVEPQLDGLNTPIKNVAGTENVGGIGNNVYNAEKNLLKGRPIIPVEYCQTLGTVGDIILADLKAYAAGVQGTIQSAISMHLRFDYAEQAFRFMFAVDGQPWLASPLTPYKGSNTLSPFVALATR
jgi:HK97 family phage major capsid protein